MVEGVSCLCLTYGRPELLEEAVESFKRQRWDGPKELIIVNDHPEQELSCADDEIVVVNLKRRLRTLGEKRNFSVALAKHDYLLVWDDDDIHLPWRIEETMRALPADQFFKCPRVWVSIQDRLEEQPRHDDYIYHGAAAYSREVFKKIGGYKCMNGGEDQDFESRIRNNSSTNKHWKLTNLPVERLYFIYRRRHGHYRTSGCRSLGEINPIVRGGKYRLRPHWKKDYCDEISRHIERLHIPSRNT